MPGTILFGIDVETASQDAEGFAHYGCELFHELAVPVTWYVTGQTLERYPREFHEVDASSLIELQAHTYNHILLKTVLIQVPAGRCVHGSTDWYMERGASIPEIVADLDRCQRVFEDVLGRPATAMTAPWNYYRGLGDRPDLLAIVHSFGFRILRSFGRDERDGQPVPLDWQPFRYVVQGFPHVLELMLHDYQDEFYWRDFAAPPADASYLDHLKEVADRVAAANLTWSLCSHDHGSAKREDFSRRKGWFREIVQYAKGLGIRFLAASPFYEEMQAKTKCP